MLVDISKADIAAAVPLLLDQHSLVQLGTDGRIIASTPKLAELVESRSADLVGKRLDDLFLPVANSPMPDNVARLSRGESLECHLRRQRPSGRLLFLDTTFVPIRDAQGVVTGALGCLNDVTEEYVIEETKDAMLAALSRSMAVIEFTRDGEVVSANDNFLNALGYRIDEIKGRHHRMFVDPAMAASAEYAEFWRALGRGESQIGEFKRIGKSGEPVWIVATYAAVTDENGQVTRVVKYATDVTERKIAVDALVDGIGRLAEGDLTATIDRELAGEFLQVREAFNSALLQFSDMVDEIRARAESMRADTGSIAAGADDLARRGETQAASLEETAAAVEEISGNVAATSQSAREADESARAAEQIVRSGAGIVTEAIAAMERIETHTRDMAEFTRVIENFAFQTNLLSINAAVEAARAGEVGRGFAVVANEVRNLAQQSAKASQSIADLIGKSESEVTTGVRLVRDAGGALDRISTAVAAMASNVAGIAHATTEQATGVREVSEALSQLDSVNQSNLALSDSNAAAAAQLSNQVEEMNGLLERFRTADHLATEPAPRQGAAVPLRRSA